MMMMALSCGGGAGGLAGTKVQGTGGGTDGGDRQLTKTVLVQGPLQKSTGLFVGGINFGTDANTLVSFNGNTATTTELRAGMWLEVTGSYDSNTLQGLAQTVSYEILLTGLVTDVTGDDFVVDGLTIHTDYDTFFDEGLSLDELSVGQNLTVSGTVDANNTVYASYVSINDENLSIDYEDEDPDFEFEDDYDILSLEGTIDSLQGTTGFTVDGRLILLNDDSQILGSTGLTVGTEVVVYGESVSSGIWNALEVFIEEDVDGEEWGSVEAINNETETLTVSGNLYQWDEFSFFIDFSEGDEFEADWDEILVGDQVYIEYAVVSGVRQILWAERLFTNGEVELEGAFEEEGGVRFFVSFDTYRSYTFSNASISDAELLEEEVEVRGIVRPDLFGHDFEAETWVLERTDL